MRREIIILIIICLLGVACGLPGAGKSEVREPIDWENEGFASKGGNLVGVGDINEFPYHEYEYYELNTIPENSVYTLVGDTCYALQNVETGGRVTYQLLESTRKEGKKADFVMEDDRGIFQSLDAWGNGEVYGLLSTRGEMGQEYAICRINTSGELVSRTDVTEGYREAGISNGMLQTQGRWFVDSAGYSYIIGDNDKVLYVFDKSGKHLLTEDYSDSKTIFFTGVFHAPDGQVIMHRIDTGKHVTEFLCLQGGRFKTLGKQNEVDGKCFVFDSEDYIYYLTGSMLVKWDIKEGDRKVLFSFYQGATRIDEVKAMTLGEEGSLLLYVEKEGKLEVVCLWDQEVEAKDEIELVMLTNEEADEGYLKRSAATYSREHPDIPIIRCEIMEGEEADIRNRIFAELVNEEGPDMLWITGEDMKILAEKGLLADLTEYLSEETRDQIFPEVIESGTVNESFVGIFPTGYVSKLVVSDEVWQEDSWSLMDVLALAAEPGRKGIVALPWSGAEPTKLPGLILSRTGLWNIQESGLLEDDGQILRQLLEASKNNSQEYLEPEERDKALSEGLYILTATGNIPNYNLFTREMVSMPENCHFVGYPGQKDGIGYWVATNYLVVNKNTVHVEVIKDFLENMFSYDYLLAAEMNCVREDVIRARIGEGNPEMLISPYYMLAGGRMVEVETRADGSTFTEEYIAFLKNCGSEPGDTNELKNIIITEADEYFSNKRNLDETVRIIQNRVTLYMEEQ